MNCIVFCINEEYVNLNDIESACLQGMAMLCPLHRGSEWFRGSLEDTRAVIEDTLNTAQVSFTDSIKERKKIYTGRRFNE